MGGEEKTCYIEQFLIVHKDVGTIYGAIFPQNVIKINANIKKNITCISINDSWTT